MPAPPLLGYNNNVRHRGRIFHIQTEDSGVGSPRIMTHLFADGGRIVKSTRTDYSEHVGRPEMADVVKNMMKDQHKAMFVALRSGELDELIGFEPGAPDETKPVDFTPNAPGVEPKGTTANMATPVVSTQTASTSAVAAKPFVSATPAAAAAAMSTPAGVATPGASVEAAPATIPSASEKAPSSRSKAARPAASPASRPEPRADKDAAPASAPGKPPSDRPYAAPRPAAIFSVPPSGSIFGEVGIDEKSLDDAILSYLAEDPKKKE